jgi:hypothetical protein
MTGFLVKHEDEYMIMSDQLFDAIISKADTIIINLWKDIISLTDSVYIHDEQLYEAIDTLIKTKQNQLIEALFNTIKENEDKERREERLRK